MAKIIEDLQTNSVTGWLDEHAQKLEHWSTEIWNYAELGLHEFKSSKLLADQLENEGFTIEMGVAGMPTAFVATWGTGGPVVGILGEYDALPGLSQKLVAKKEPVIEDANGHGCGHNIYGVAAAGGAIAAKNYMQKEGIAGTIKFYGCPAEETLVGKVFMAREGVFNDADVCLTWHPNSINSLWASSSLAMNSVKFNFYGKSAHAAANPETGRSALKAAQLMDIGVNFLREHLIDEIRIHSTITNGGGGPNVVPDKSQIWYYIRAPHRSEVEETYEKLINIAKGAALMTGTEYDIDFITGCYEMIPNKVLESVLFTNMEKVGAPSFDDDDIKFAEELTETFDKGMKEVVVKTSGAPSELLKKVLHDEVIAPYDKGKCMSGSTDVADVSWNIPTAQFTTACAPIGTPGHSWQNVASVGSAIGKKGMLSAAKIIGLSVVELMEDDNIIAQAKEEFDAEMKQKGGYISPLPEQLKPPVPAVPAV
ncbi:amidohydrolase [Fictibacillus enclensis]|uniref:amidohydrolase n=1 Tax=Fictibacillus enclensis TaxID=1017270 RepID=UPI0025A20B54|nr:amidohydrolase [Fictibacillus enclensis]MDM5197206.1 amidohydrolase [Fictibacillus enclensis]